MINRLLHPGPPSRRLWKCPIKGCKQQMTATSVHRCPKHPHVRMEAKKAV
jgi:hypothetical protein